MDLETFAHNYGMPWLRFVRSSRRTVRLKGCSTSGLALGSRQCELMCMVFEIRRSRGSIRCEHETISNP